MGTHTRSSSSLLDTPPSPQGWTFPLNTPPHTPTELMDANTFEPKDGFAGLGVADKEHLDEESRDATIFISSSAVESEVPIASSRHFIDVDLHAITATGSVLSPQTTTVVDGILGDARSPSRSPIHMVESSASVAVVGAGAGVVAVEGFRSDTVSEADIDPRFHATEEDLGGCDMVDSVEASCGSEASMVPFGNAELDGAVLEDTHVAKFLGWDADTSAFESVASYAMVDPTLGCTNDDGVGTDACAQTRRPTEPDTTDLGSNMSPTSRNLAADIGPVEKPLGSSVSLPTSEAVVVAVVVEGINKAIKPTDTRASPSAASEAALVLETRCCALVPSGVRVRACVGCWSGLWQPRANPGKK